jgi:hypothetical protein
MGEIGINAKWLFSEALEVGPERVLKEHRHHAKFLHRLKKKLKNPVHFKTGKPLNPNTIKWYREHELPWRLGWLYDTKIAIQMLVAYGIIGKKKPNIKPGKVVYFHAYQQKKDIERCVKEALENLTDFIED